MIHEWRKALIPKSFDPRGERRFVDLDHVPL